MLTLKNVTWILATTTVTRNPHPQNPAHYLQKTQTASLEANSFCLIYLILFKAYKYLALRGLFA